MLTKPGQKCRLITYQITSTKIIGKDKETNMGKIENVQSITVMYKQSVVDVLVATAFIIVAFMAFLLVTFPSSI